MSTSVFEGQHQPTVSGWIVSNEASPRVLLVFHKKLQSWLQPGGHIEPNENPWDAVVREVKEETSLDVSNFPGRLQTDDITLELLPPRFLQVQQIPAYQDQPMHYHVDLQYVFVIPPQDVALQASESEQIGWFTLEEALNLTLIDNTRARIQELLSEGAA